MDQFAEFAMNHWMLVTAFFVVLGLLIANLASGAGGLGPQEAVQLINREDALPLDVRPASEYEAGHLRDAVHLPMADLPKSLDRLKKHRERPLLVYCATGSSAGQAARQLKAAGFERTHVLRGGLTAWRNENLPVTTS